MRNSADQDFHVQIARQARTTAWRLLGAGMFIALLTIALNCRAEDCATCIRASAGLHAGVPATVPLTAN